MHYIFPSSVKRHLGWLYLLAVLNNAAMSMGIQISIQVPAFSSFGSIPRSGIVRSYSDSVFKFLRNCHVNSHSSYMTLHSPQQCARGSNCPTSLPPTLYLSRKYREFSYTPCPHTCTVFPTLSIHVTIIHFMVSEPIPKHTYPLKSWVYIKVHSWGCTFYGFWPVYNIREVLVTSPPCCMPKCIFRTVW